MGSDRARVTYDPRQQYRSVVMQQGRLTLEADWNEAFQINNESLRKESLDFVGPCGTPDDGYAVFCRLDQPRLLTISPSAGGPCTWGACEPISMNPWHTAINLIGAITSIRS